MMRHTTRPRGHPGFDICSLHWPLMLMMLVGFGWPGEPLANERDRDGDGHVAERFGGDDCDDRDGNRYPGNTEVCNASHHDEDCNPETFGYRDADGDGEVDVLCCNRLSNGRLNCGTDCDDKNRAIQPASQVCDGLDVVICGRRGRFERAECPRNTVCVNQPNGTGVCMVRPEGYVAPPRFKRMNAQATGRPPASRHRPLQENRGERKAPLKLMERVLRQ